MWCVRATCAVFCCDQNLKEPEVLPQKVTPDVNANVAGDENRGFNSDLSDVDENLFEDHGVIEAVNGPELESFDGEAQIGVNDNTLGNENKGYESDISDIDISLFEEHGVIEAVNGPELASFDGEAQIEVNAHTLDDENKGYESDVDENLSDVDENLFEEPGRTEAVGNLENLFIYHGWLDAVNEPELASFDGDDQINVSNHDEKGIEMKILSQSSGENNKVDEESIGAISSDENSSLGFSSIIGDPLFRGTNQIECNCCLVGYAFETMIQCPEGHLFCADCLKSYVHEAVFGQGRLMLECMHTDCSAAFLRNHLQQTLPEKLFASYEERLLEESIKLADIEGLVRCAHCDYAAIMPDDLDVFECQNPTCGKQTCRHCKKPWEGHDDKPCVTIDENETSLRIKYEEQLTLVKIRVCKTCKTGFTKSDGCNKMVCRCGKAMCYLCRKTDIDYTHFCGHARDPDHPKYCQKCDLCSLWTDPTEDEALAMEELKSLAERERRWRGFTSEKEIGAN